MDLVTNAEVIASWPGFASLPADEQAALISDASQAIEDYCGRSFGTGDVTEAHDGANRGRLWLKHRPVISVDAIRIDGVDLDNTDGTSWTVNLRTGELVRGAGHDSPRFAPWFPAGTQNIEVDLTYGYEGGLVPGPVKRACLMTIRHLSEATKLPGMYTSEAIGSYSYSRDPDGGSVAIPAAATMLLRNYVQDDII